MVVRFLPLANKPSVASANDRGDLAEVIELRSKLHSDRGVAARVELAEIEHAVVHRLDDAGEPESDRFSAAEADAVRLLARRARSGGELRQELDALGHASIDVEAVVLQCESNLYLDDLGLARVLTEGLR